MIYRCLLFLLSEIRIKKIKGRFSHFLEKLETSLLIVFWYLLDIWQDKNFPLLLERHLEFFSREAQKMQTLLIFIKQIVSI